MSADPGDDGWILVVDDDQGICDAMVVLLSEEGYRVEATSNGADALARLRGSPWLPRVILLDLMMPVMDGFEFRRRQQAEPRLAGIPVIVFTAGMIGDEVMAMGARDCLPKPIDIDRLLLVIERAFQSSSAS